MHNKLGGLEIVRAIAALAVMAGHMRGMYFVDFNELEQRTIFARLFYFLTGFGHQAVIVFFVLSGFLVGGSVLEKFENGTWSWSKYLIQRISRLWVVLLPSLLMTFFFDTIGHTINSQLYEGSYYEIIHQGPKPGDYSLSFKTLVGNIFFLQTWITPIFGSNGPMWSLFNEFWYYLTFPLFCSLVFNTSTSQFVVKSLFFLLLSFFLPVSLIEGFLAWISGAFIGKSIKLYNTPFNNKSFYFALIVFIFSLSLSRFDFIRSDIFISVSFCIFIIPLSSLQYKSTTFSFISESSYSIYLFHFPFALFISSYFIPHRHQFDFFNLLVFILFFIFCFIYCIIFYYIFEFRTNSIRRFLDSRLLTIAPQKPNRA